MHNHNHHTANSMFERATELAAEDRHDEALECAESAILLADEERNWDLVDEIERYAELLRIEIEQEYHHPSTTVTRPASREQLMRDEAAALRAAGNIAAAEAIEDLL